MIRVERHSSKQIAKAYRFFNRKFFGGRLPRTNRVFFLWSDWILSGDDSMGVSVFKVFKLGPFRSNAEAREACGILNRKRTRKNQDFDYYRIHKDGPKSLIPVPFICLASEMKCLAKSWHKTLLHEMIHLDLELRGLPHVNHGRYFDRERQRLLRSPIIRRNLF